MFRCTISKVNLLFFVALQLARLCGIMCISCLSELKYVIGEQKKKHIYLAFYFWIEQMITIWIVLVFSWVGWFFCLFPIFATAGIMAICCISSLLAPDTLISIYDTTYFRFITLGRPLLFFVFLRSNGHCHLLT